MTGLLDRWRGNPDVYYLLHSYLFIAKKLYREKMVTHVGRLHGVVLDVGCGRKPYSSLIQCNSYVGVERNASLEPDVVADAVSLPFKAGAFDSVLCTEVIEHIPEPEEAVREIQRVLKPGGVLLLSAPMSWNLHYEPYDFYRFTKYGLAYLLEKHRFSIESIDRVGGAFSLAGARVTQVLCTFLYKRLRLLPAKMGSIIVRMFVAIPLSLLFYLIARLLDRIDDTEAISWIVTAAKLS